jgi:hypothetical protein
MECMMRLNSAGAAIVLGCMSMLSACEIDQADRTAPGYSGYSSAIVAIGDSSATLIGATLDPCKLDLGNPFWRQNGGQDGYEQRCGHSPPD